MTVYTVSAFIAICFVCWVYSVLAKRLAGKSGVSRMSCFMSSGTLNLNQSLGEVNFR